MKINRRDFSRLSAMALAASQLPASAQTAPAARPLGFAAVGLGTISDIFMSACVRGLSPRSPSKNISSD